MYFWKEKWSGLATYIESKPINHEICLCFDKDVTIDGIQDFITRLKINKPFEITYIDPKDMPCNDIAEMKDKNILIKTINKRKNIDNLFINTFNLEEI